MIREEDLQAAVAEGIIDQAQAVRLSHLARLRGVSLPVYPGSDMTADLLASPAAEGLTIAVFGPDRAAFNALWQAWLPEGCAPARACVSAELASPDYLLEIVFTVAVPQG